MIEKLKQSRVAKIIGVILYFVILISAVSYDIYILIGKDSPIKFNEDVSQEQEYDEPEEEPDEEKVLAKATITVTGDIMSHMPIINSAYNAGAYNFSNIFTNIKKYVSEADFAVGNLETTLAGTENGNVYSGYPQFNCPDTIVDAAKDAGFDLLLTANNHSYDTGAYGMKRTQEIVRAKGLLNLGTRMTSEEKKYIVQDINGIKVGMVCYTYGEIDGNGRAAVNGIPISAEQSANINVFDYAKLDKFFAEMEQHIADMKNEGAEAVVLFIHWGVEYQTKQNNEQSKIAGKMCELGVDVIAGGHPHVVQPVEIITSATNSQHKTLCVYSMGNAVSNQRSSVMNLKTGHTEDGMLFSFTFVKYSDGRVMLDSAEILPTWVYLNNGKYTILPLDKEIEDWQTAFGIGSNSFNNANASYERTMALVDDGLNSAVTYLEESVSMYEAGVVAAVG